VNGRSWRSPLSLPLDVSSGASSASSASPGGGGVGLADRRSLVQWGAPSIERVGVSDQRFSIVCLSSQAWSVDLPTNRQQIMRRAASRGHRVLFVETGGFLGRHLWRLVRGGRRHSLLRRLLGSERVASDIHVRMALNVLPWGHKHRLASVVNASLTNVVVRRMARRLPQPVVLWVYDPYAARSVGSCGEVFAVYDCVDDYPEQAGPDPRRRELAVRGDEEAASRSRLVFATTSPLHDRHLGFNPKTYLVPNVGDYEHFAPASDPAFASADLAALPRPIVGFAGNFTAAKVDFDLLEALSAERPDWTLVLIGPARSDTRKRLTRLAARPNIRWLGAKPYADLPRYVAAFDVGLILYEANEYTRSCFPLKLYEYLAAGKPVVATGLPQLAGMEPDVIVTAGDSGSVIAAVEDALGMLGDGDRRRRMALAVGNTWETRAGRLLELVAGELAARA
jgi:glycosyltransferase involved in cell wall biosynthesis